MTMVVAMMIGLEHRHTRTCTQGRKLWALFPPTTAHSSHSLSRRRGASGSDGVDQGQGVRAPSPGGYPPGVEVTIDEGLRMVIDTPSAMDWFDRYLPAEADAGSNADMDRSNWDALHELEGGQTKERDTHEGLPSGFAPLLSDSGVLFAEQKPGDLVFIPHGWWHCVLNLEECVAFTQNIVNCQNCRPAVAELAVHHPVTADRMRQLAWARRSWEDSD